MCGFAGILDASGQARSEPLCRAAAAMADAVRHRGPDDAGAWANEEAGIALGFQRLAIVDLTAAGHQPLLSADGQLALVFNGEIYNHQELRDALDREAPQRWAGHSDTETLVAGFRAWGVRATLERVVGMFALALWEQDARQLHLARDRFGEKPLYFGWTPQRAFVFGSELAALRRAPGFEGVVDRDALALYLRYRAVPAPYSIYRGIYKLEPGCLLTLPAAAAATPLPGAPFAPGRYGAVTLDRYWSLPDAARRGLADPISDDSEAITRTEAALREAVRLQSIADVPLGAFLSGGIDSSLIVALMQAQSRGRVRTFTIGFDETGFDEAAHARAVASHLGTEHTELYVSGAEALAVVPRLPAIYSEPFADSSQIPTHLVAAMARRHVTVALSGDGGDELFGGYNRYTWAGRLWTRLRRVPTPMQRIAATMTSGIPAAAWDAVGARLPGRYRVAALGDKAHRMAARLGADEGLPAFYRKLATSGWTTRPVVPGASPLRLPDAAAAPLEELSPAERMMVWDAVGYLPDDILQKVDRAAMAVSLETRAPFLDHRVAELAWRLPLRMKVRDGRGKWVVRQVLHRYVPQALIERPKAGFAIPLAEWLRGPLRAWADELLSPARLEASGLLDGAAIRELWHEHVSGVRAWHDELWCVLMFQAWLDAER